MARERDPDGVEKGEDEIAFEDDHEALRLNPKLARAFWNRAETERIMGREGVIGVAREAIEPPGEERGADPRGDRDEPARRAAATDDDRKTEAYGYDGLDPLQTNQADAAREHFRRAKEHGNRTLMDSIIPLADLDRREAGAPAEGGGRSGEGAGDAVMAGGCRDRIRSRHPGASDPEVPRAWRRPAFRDRSPTWRPWPTCSTGWGASRPIESGSDPPPARRPRPT